MEQNGVPRFDGRIYISHYSPPAIWMFPLLYNRRKEVLPTTQQQKKKKRDIWGKATKKSNSISDSFVGYYKLHIPIYIICKKLAQLYSVSKYLKRGKKSKNLFSSLN